MRSSHVKRLFVFLFAVIIAFSAIGQEDTTKVKALMKQADEFSRNDIKKSVKIIKEAYTLSLKISDKKIKGECLNLYGWIEILNCNYPDALKYLLESLKIAQETKDKNAQANIMRDLAIAYHYQGPENFPSAIEYAKKSLLLFQELKKKGGIAKCYQELGGLYSDNISEPTFNLKWSQNYFEKALEIQKELGNKVAIAQLQSALGYVCGCNKDFAKAIGYIESSCVIYEEEKDNLGIMYAHYTLADIYYRMGNMPLAISQINKCIEMANEYGNKDLLNNAYEVLSGYHTESGDYKNALQDYKKSVAFKFEMYNEERIKAFADLEKKYESEKKQKEIELLNKDKELQKTEINRQTTQKYAFIGGFVFMLLLSVVIFKSYRDKKKANVLLAQQKSEIEEKNEELNQQNEEIAAQRDALEQLNIEVTAQRDEIEAQRDLVTDQRDHIEEQKKEITDSINYAKLIQEAVLPVSEQARSVLGEHFILFKPKDIVSGDFYSVTKINQYLFVTVADCTGHGVPGGFMSMMGISFLNEIIRKEEITTASEVLDHLRELIIESLQQSEQLGKHPSTTLMVKDGMDISLCILNTENNLLQFAGANNNMLIVTSENELKVIPADKQPVAIYLNMKPFTNHQIQLKKGDCIYLTSDGYQDQFGGPDLKKFLVKRFKELLVKINDKSMAKQKEIIEQTFENWKGGNQQIDDVTVLGFKINI